MKVALALLFFTGCGLPDAVLRAEITLPPAVTLDQVQAVDFIVLSATSAKGVHVTCSDAPSDYGTDDNVLYHHFTSAGGALHFVNVPSGKGLVVLVNAYQNPDGLGLPFATACQDNVTIAAGTTQTLKITLHGSR